MDKIGLFYQVSTILINLLVLWMLARTDIAKWGYLVGFLSIFLWMAMEIHYAQWFYLCINPVYFYLYGKGFINRCHRRQLNEDA